MLIIFIVCTPALKSNYLLFIHSVMIPFIAIHWVLNDNTCAITAIEKKVRYMIYKNPNVLADCVTCRIIDPVYNYKNDSVKERRKFVYSTVFILWCITLYHLFYRRRCGKIKGWQDLMRM